MFQTKYLITSVSNIWVFYKLEFFTKTQFLNLSFNEKLSKNSGMETNF